MESVIALLGFCLASPACTLVVPTPARRNVDEAGSHAFTFLLDSVTAFTLQLVGSDWLDRLRIGSAKWTCRPHERVMDPTQERVEFRESQASFSSQKSLAMRQLPKLDCRLASVPIPDRELVQKRDSLELAHNNSGFLAVRLQAAANP